VFSLQCFFFFLRAAVSAVLQPYHTCQIALCTSFGVLVSWQINDDDDDDDDDDAYGNYEHVHGSTTVHSTGQYYKLQQ